VLGVDEIIKRLVTGPTAATDVLSLNERLFFMCYCGVGWDASVCRAYTQARQNPTMQTLLRGRLLNETFYAILALRYWATRLPGLSLRLDRPKTGQATLEIPAGACAVLVSNVASYAGGAPLTTCSCIGDGLFEVTLVPRAWLYALLVLSRYWPRLRRFHRLQSQQARELHLSLPCGLAVQVDGDDANGGMVNHTSLSIRVAGQIAAIYLPS
jgi:diacylglycerol kinase family enzyme